MRDLRAADDQHPPARAVNAREEIRVALALVGGEAVPSVHVPGVEIHAPRDDAPAPDLA
jgi:hypothetical protein